MRGSATIAGLGLILSLATIRAETGNRWIHIHVDDDGDRIRVNLPLSLVEEVLPLVDSGDLKAGRVRLHAADAPRVDLQRVWDAVRKAPPGEFVTVEGTDGTVRVARAAGFLTVHVDEPSSIARRGERVRVKVPITAVDALLSAGGDELDVVALIRALGEGPGEDLVTVEQGASTRVRIWIDASPAPR